MWLLHLQQTDGVVIKHARNGREYKLPELPHFSVDGYCAETNTIYEYFGCHWHGHHCQRFCDIPTTNGDTLAARYEHSMSRLEQLTRAVYQVKVQWECEFDDAGIQTPELLAHPAVCQSPLCTRDALYGGRAEAMRLHHKAREGETIQYMNVMSLYPYICKYFKFIVGHPVIHVGDSCKDKEACFRMDGLIKCSIVPPETLYHPVLPFPSQLETHVLSVPNLRPNLQYRRMLSYDIRGEP
jgi:G:T-mismatch repair DNA endonuclease (very short patch repair protein)